MRFAHNESMKITPWLPEITAPLYGQDRPHAASRVQTKNENPSSSTIQLLQVQGINL